MSSADVNVIPDETDVTKPAAPCPKPHWGWAVVALFFFWPLCIPAFIDASKVNSACVAGDQAAAKKASARAKKLGQIALIVGIAGAVITAIVIVTNAFNVSIKINWLALVEVTAVTLGVTVLAVGLVALAAKVLDDGHHLQKQDKSPGVRIVVGYIMFGMVGLIVLFGIYLIIPYFPKPWQ